jgi:hypothetical protein
MIVNFVRSPKVWRHSITSHLQLLRISNFPTGRRTGIRVNPTAVLSIFDGPFRTGHGDSYLKETPAKSQIVGATDRERHYGENHNVIRTESRKAPLKYCKWFTKKHGRFSSEFGEETFDILGSHPIFIAKILWWYWNYWEAVDRRDRGSQDRTKNFSGPSGMIDHWDGSACPGVRGPELYKGVGEWSSFMLFRGGLHVKMNRELTRLFVFTEIIAQKQQNLFLNEITDRPGVYFIATWRKCS